MANKQLSLPGEIVKKSNALLRCRWSAESVWEPRLVALLAARVRSTDKEFQVYEIPISEIFDFHAGGKDYKELEKIADSLMSRVLTIYDDDDGWTKYNVFSPCRFHRSRGILEIKFHPDLLPHYLNLKKNFAKYNLMEFLLLPSVYSQRIFEFLKSWGDKSEVIIQIGDLHEMLNTPASSRKNFAELKRYILDKAHKDILKYTNLYYEWEAIKKGRSVSSIRFIFGKKKSLDVSKAKDADAQQKKSKKSNKDFLTAMACRQERGPACEGGRQEENICEICRRFRS